MYIIYLSNKEHTQVHYDYITTARTLAMANPGKTVVVKYDNRFELREIYRCKFTEEVK